MISTLSPFTLFLAKAFGAYMLLAGLSFFTSKDRWIKLLDDLQANTALVYVTGVLVFALGCGLVYSHNIWVDPLAIIISIIAWAALVEGALFIAIPEIFLKYSISLLRPATYTPFAIFAILAGLALLICGFTGVAGTLPSA